MKHIESHKLSFDVSLTGGFEIEHMPQIMDSECGESIYIPHTHSYYEIIWFQEGEGVHTIDFVEYTIKPNTFFFISPGQIHNFDKKKAKGTIFKFIPEFLSDEYTTEDIFLKYSIFNTIDTPPYKIIDSEDKLYSLHRMESAMEREIPRLSSFGHHRFLQSLLRIMLIIFERHESENITSVNSEHVLPELNVTNNVHNHFIRFRQALENNYSHLHNVKDYAELLGVGTKYLTTIVKECSHRTPLQLINERILLEAKRQLRYSNKMVKEIAFDLGYDDPSYFVKQFKRHMGMLPTEFREK